MIHHRGFSFLEVVTVILIVSILSVMSMVSLPSMGIFQTVGFKSQLFEDLQWTQVLSMSQNQRYKMVIGSNSYQIQDQNNTPVTHPALNTTTITYPTGVTVSPSTTVIFDAVGVPYSATNVPLDTPLILTVSSTDNEQTVTITPQTGLTQ